MYNEKIISIFQHLKNSGEIRSCSGIGKVGDAAQGDVIKVFLKIEDNIIEQAKAKVFGSVATIVCVDVAMGLIKGKSVEQALELSAQDITEIVGTLPASKKQSVMLAQEAVEDAIRDYRKRQLRATIKAD